MPMIQRRKATRDKRSVEFQPSLRTRLSRTFGRMGAVDGCGCASLDVTPPAECIKTDSQKLGRSSYRTSFRDSRRTRLDENRNRSGNQLPAGPASHSVPLHSYQAPGSHYRCAELPLRWAMVRRFNTPRTTTVKLPVLRYSKAGAAVERTDAP